MLSYANKLKIKDPDLFHDVVRTNWEGRDCSAELSVLDNIEEECEDILAEFYPNGGLCLSCVHRESNECWKHDFSNMRVIGKDKKTKRFMVLCEHRIEVNHPVKLEK